MFFSGDSLPAVDDLLLRRLAEKQTEISLLDPEAERNEALKITLHTMMQLEGVDCGAICAASQDENLLLIEAPGFSTEFARQIPHFKEIKEFLLLRRSSRSTPLTAILEKENLQGLVVIPIVHDRKKLALMVLGSHAHGIDRIPVQGQTMMKLVSHLAGQLLARLQAAVTLKDREARLLAVVAQSFDGILVVDRDYRIIEWNAAQTNLTGYSEEEMLGQKVWDYFYQIIPDENKNPELFELIKSRVQDPPAFMINTRNTFPLQCKDGSRKTMEVSWSEVETRGKKLYCVIMRDVTQRQTAEQNYQMLFREMRNGFALHEIILDEKGTPVNYRFLAINPAFERMTGLKAGDIVGKTVLEVMPNLEGYWIETYGRVALTGEPVVFENYSHELNQHFNISAFQPQTGQFACIIEDITERKRAETELRDAHDKLETLWNIASMEDADTKTISETVLETITHITGSQVGFYGYVTDDETAMEIAAWSRGVLERCSVGEETLKLCMSDSGVWAEGIRQRKPLIINDYNDDIPGKKGLPEGHIPIKNLMVVPHFLHHKIISIAAVANRETGYNEDDAEQISTFLTSIEAIVDRKRAEEALRKSEERYHLIDEASQDLIYSYDLEGRLTHANTKLCLLLGRRSEEIIGKTNEELGISPEQGKALARAVQKVLQTKQSYIEEIVIMQGDEQQYFEVITNPIHDPSGNIIGVAGMTRDITARKKAELQIREQLDELSRWHNVTLGRESRILELKREVNALLEEAGKPPRYGSAKEATLE